MKVKVIIEEHISKEFEVEANSVEEAMEVAEEKYYNEEFVVDACNEPTCKLMAANDGWDWTEWVEF